LAITNIPWLSGDFPMNSSRAVLLIGSTLTLPWIGVASIAQTPAAPIAARPTVQQTPVYKPPLLGAPATRVGGASRNGFASSLTLSVLAPESTGLTSRTQPTLYWYVAKGLTTPLEFILNDDHSIKPLVEMTVSAAQPGIHALRLSYPLKIGVEYQWAMVAVVDPEQRAGDLIASGTIRRVAPSPALTAQLSQVGPAERALLYAQEGFWYDAIATLSEQIDTHPVHLHWREQRAALLDQVGLNAVAAQDRQSWALATEPAHAAH
jgi:hypothetical protein